MKHYCSHSSLLPANDNFLRCCKIYTYRPPILCCKGNFSYSEHVCNYMCCIPYNKILLLYYAIVRFSHQTRAKITKVSCPLYRITNIVPISRFLSHLRNTKTLKAYLPIEIQPGRCAQREHVLVAVFELSFIIMIIILFRVPTYCIHYKWRAACSDYLIVLQNAPTALITTVNYSEC